jgi:hypothetical protein
MLEATLWLLAAFALIFAINLMPALMPASWMVMAFFYIQFDLPLLVLTIGGAIASACGRLLLAKGSAWTKRALPRASREDLDELGAFLDERRHVLAPTAFLYALTPLPTNNLFVAAGLAGVSLVHVIAGFLAARMIVDSIFVWTTERVFDNLGDVFSGAYGSWVAIALQAASVTSILLLYRVPWARWLRRLFQPRATASAGD